MFLNFLVVLITLYKVFHENILEYETGQEDVKFVENSNFNPQRYTCRLWIK